MKEKRTFKKEEKLAILKEASEQGVKITLEKHGIYPSCVVAVLLRLLLEVTVLKAVRW